MGVGGVTKWGGAQNGGGAQTGAGGVPKWVGGHPDPIGEPKSYGPMGTPNGGRRGGVSKSGGASKWGLGGPIFGGRVPKWRGGSQNVGVGGGLKMGVGGPILGGGSQNGGGGLKMGGGGGGGGGNPTPLLYPEIPQWDFWGEKKRIWASTKKQHGKNLPHILSRAAVGKKSRMGL